MHSLTYVYDPLNASDSIDQIKLFLVFGDLLSKRVCASFVKCCTRTYHRRYKNVMFLMWMLSFCVHITVRDWKKSAYFNWHLKTTAAATTRTPPLENNNKTIRHISLNWLLNYVKNNQFRRPRDTVSCTQWHTQI